MQRRCTGSRGFSLLEVMVALMVFMMMTLMFGAIFPTTVRSTQYSSNYAQASLLAQHKIDQLRSAGFGNLAYANLIKLGIIDPTNPKPAATGPYSYTFTTVDRLVDSGTTPGFFPAGSTGTITLVKDPHAPLDLFAPVNPEFRPGSSMVRATVSIRWPSKGTRVSSYSATTILIQMSHQ